MRRATVVLLFAILGIAPAGAARLPVRHLTSVDGLSDSDILRVRVDRFGFVWAAGESGLWRFDGERFEKLGPAWGLPDAGVNDLEHAPDGRLWVATHAGVYRGDTAAPAPDGRVFARVPLDDAGREIAFRVRAAPDGTVYLGTFGSLWRVPAGASRAQRVPLEPADSARGISRVMALAFDPEGNLWIGTHLRGLYRLRSDGSVQHRPGGPGTDFIRDLLFDEAGEAWSAYYGGLARLGRDPFADPASPITLVGTEAHPGIDTTALLPLEAGRFLIASTTGITEIRRSEDGRWSVGGVLDRASGLPVDSVRDVDRDASGNLWIGLAFRGLAQRIAGGVVTHDELDAAGTGVRAIVTDRDGRPAVLTHTASRRLTLWRSDARGRFVAMPLTPPAGKPYAGWGWQQVIAHDPSGAWWVAWGDGLLRYDRLDRPPSRVYRVADGLPGNESHKLFLDSRGDLWTTGSNSGSSVLSSIGRIRRGSTTADRFTVAEIGTGVYAAGFAEDRDGNLWIAFEDGRLVRRKGGRFETIDAGPGRPASVPWLVDRAGRLWLLGSTLRVCDRPGESRPRFRTVALPEELEGVDLLCGVEDGEGRLLLGSPRGLLRLDPESGAHRLLTTSDGLSGNTIRIVEADASGRLWFSDGSGVSRLDPVEDPPALPAVARLRAVRLSGESVPLPALGGTSVGPIELRPGERTLDIDWFSVHHGPGPAPTFQYRLEGLDAAWSPPTDERSIVYAGLAPGRYRFEVRALDVGGVSRSPTASLSFRVLAPFWRQGWFLALAVAAIAACAYVAYRLRVARLLEIERVRTRIATDLHDEIGSTLSQISVLSQVASRETARAPGARSRALSRITELAGDVVDAMSDTVWAISPRGDTLADLVHRMRRFASELFADDTAILTLDLPADGSAEHLDAEVRRAVYLVFKESLHNVRKHSGARNVHVALRREPGGLALTVRDDGRGFDGPWREGGHGLRSMRRRAEALGGTLVVRSGEREGTEVTLAVRAPTAILSEWIGARRRRRG